MTLNKQTPVVEADGKPSIPFQVLFNQLVERIAALEARVTELES